MICADDSEQLFGENGHVDEIQQRPQAIEADHDLEVTGKREARNHVKRDEDACVQFVEVA